MISVPNSLTMYMGPGSSTVAAYNKSFQLPITEMQQAANKRVCSVINGEMHIPFAVEYMKYSIYYSNGFSSLSASSDPRGHQLRMEPSKCEGLNHGAYFLNPELLDPAPHSGAQVEGTEGAPMLGTMHLENHTFL